jgi:transposase
MTLYLAVDFHARQQTVGHVDPGTGEVVIERLWHQDLRDIRRYYEQFRGQEVIVGLEASGYSLWFEQLLEDLGHIVWLGNATEIRRQARRRQKSDERDTRLMLELLHAGEFPQVWRPGPASLEVMRLVRLRHKLVKVRTMVKNYLHAVAINGGLSLKSRLFSRRGLDQFRALALTPVLGRQRDQLLGLLEPLGGQVDELTAELERRAAADPEVARLRTHPGVGLLTALALVHILGPVERFGSLRKVTAYVGLDPMERSSAERKRYGGISKAGSPLLRQLLSEAVMVAIRLDPELRRFHARLLRRKSPRQARTAAARKLLIRCFIMRREGIDYAEFVRRGRASQPAGPLNVVGPDVPVV